MREVNYSNYEKIVPRIFSKYFQWQAGVDAGQTGRHKHPQSGIYKIGKYMLLQIWGQIILFLLCLHPHT